MRIEMADAWCEGHGLCAGIDAELFSLDDEGYSGVGNGIEVPPDMEELAGQGVASCPVQALRIVH